MDNHIPVLVAHGCAGPTLSKRVVFKMLLELLSLQSEPIFLLSPLLFFFLLDFILNLLEIVTLSACFVFKLIRLELRLRELLHRIGVSLRLESLVPAWNAAGHKLILLQRLIAVHIRVVLNGA